MSDDPTIYVNQKLKINITMRDEDRHPIDLSAAGTTTVLTLKRAGGTLKTFAVVFETDGTDGKCYYETVSGDLDQAGTWRGQAIWTDSDTEEIPSTVFTFEVKPRI